MDNAISTYMGGEVINSLEPLIDYETYKELGLKCPFCDQALFWRKGYIRQDGRMIAPCFVHYPGFDDSFCEKRSRTSGGQVQLEKYAQEARKQRLKFYNARLIKLLKIDGVNLYRKKIIFDVLKFETKNKTSRQLSRELERRAKDSQLWWKRNSKTVHDQVDDLMNLTIKAMPWSESFDCYSEGLLRESEISSFKLDPELASLCEKHFGWLKIIDVAFHLKICKEVVQYFGSTTAFSAWTMIYIKVVAKALLEHGKNLAKEVESGGNKHSDRALYDLFVSQIIENHSMICTDVVREIVTTDWIASLKQFNKEGIQ